MDRDYTISEAEAYARGRADALAWRPIETAPRDGSLIAVWGREPGDYGYTEDRMNATVARWSAGGWRPTRGGGRYDHGITPTHWMPLPPPPEHARAGAPEAAEEAQK